MVLSAFRYLGDELGQLGVDGLGITQTRYAADQAQPWHAHENPNFHFLLAGRFLDESRDGVRSPEPFSLVFHPAGAAHRTLAGPEGRRGLNIEPTAAWLARHGLNEADLDADSVHQDARASLTIAAVALGAFARDAVGDAVFEALFAPRGSAGETPAWFRRLEARLAEDEHRKWTLASLASEVGVHPVYLARVFRRKYGTALTPHLQQARLLRAARKLAEADCLTSVAAESGFADHAHFTRSFKAWFGMPPSQARERLRKVAIVQASPGAPRSR